MPFTQSQTCQNANFKSRSPHICCETGRFPFRIRSALSTSLTSNSTEATCISPPSSTGTAGKSWAGTSPIPWVYSPVLNAVRDAVDRFGVPAILNSDQGSQFTNSEYKQLLKQLHIRQSMDGKSRWADNIIIERWFRSLKTELIYINEFTSPQKPGQAIRGYVEDYNSLRPHEALDYKTPDSVYHANFCAA